MVLFVSNRSGANDLLNLDLSGMLGANYHVWATKVSAEAGHETDQFSAPIITNLSGSDFVMTNGVLSNFSLNSWETLRITITIGAYGANMLGYTGNDELIGSAYGDMIDGKAGNDTLSGDGGNDTMWGGDGNDDLGGGNADQDLIYGGNGNDTIGGGTGNDTMYGGAGTDTAVFWGTTAISVDLAITTGQVTGYGTDALIEVENIKTGSAADILRGSSVNNRFDSYGGNDTLDGRDGNDSLYGGAGIDSLLGGNGNDYLDAGVENDIVYGGSGNDNLFGVDGIDRLYGDAGIDNLYAGTGNDSLYGGTENDVLYGGSGNDAYYGGAGIDQFVFAKDEGADTVYDYVDNSDKIRITTAGLTFANLSFVAVSGGVQITHDAGDTITVLATGLAVSSFTASDFIFN